MCELLGLLHFVAFLAFWRACFSCCVGLRVVNGFSVALSYVIAKRAAFDALEEAQKREPQKRKTSKPNARRNKRKHTGGKQKEREPPSETGGRRDLNFRPLSYLVQVLTGF